MQTWMVDEVLATQTTLSDPNPQKVRTAPRFRFDNVTEYFFAGTPQEVWDSDDFPSVRCPFSHQWFETDAPRFINSEGTMVPWGTGRPYAWCALVRWKNRGEAAFTVTDDRVRACLAIDMFTMWNGQRGPAPLVQWQLPVGERDDLLKIDSGRGDGTVWQPFNFNRDWLSINSRQLPEQEFGTELNRQMTAFRNAVLLALSFLNCRNVTTVEREAPRQLRRREPVATWTYRVIEIQAMKRRLDEVKASADGTLQRALHICRGHFAEYSEDKPLFGKIVGRIWKPQHIRGDVASGVRVKDYKLGR
jgi:hypothetical protein